MVSAPPMLVHFLVDLPDLSFPVLSWSCHLSFSWDKSLDSLLDSLLDLFPDFLLDFLLDFLPDVTYHGACGTRSIPPPTDWSLISWELKQASFWHADPSLDSPGSFPGNSEEAAMSLVKDLWVCASSYPVKWVVVHISCGRLARSLCEETLTDLDVSS